MITSFPSGRPVRALDLTQDTQDTQAPEGRGNHNEPPDFSALTQDELVTTINQLEYDRNVIVAQIDDNRAGEGYRGPAWRRSAGHALSVRIAQIQLAYAELDRRQPAKPAKPDKPDPDIARTEAKARLKAEGAALHEAQRNYSLARIQEHQAAQALLEAQEQVKKNAAFVAAAKKKLTAKAFAAIWAMVEDPE